MNIFGLIFLLVAQFVTGNGILKLFKTELDLPSAFFLSIIVGIPVVSFAPCMLQLLHLPIAAIPLIITISIMMLLCCIPLFRNFSRPSFRSLRLPEIYEWPFLIVVFGLLFFSVWGCFYFPPYSRDALSGPELIAEYAVREKNMISSVFNIDLSTSNNYFKSPYLTGLQITYKLLVYSFGQIWLSILFLSFTGLLYRVLKQRLHAIPANALLLLFLCIPEVFSYSYLILYDYSNMVFFFCGYYFLSKYWKSKKASEFAFSAFLFGLATYIRTETLVLVVLTSPLPLLYAYRQKLALNKTLLLIGQFIIVPVAFYFVCINVFVHLFIPIPFEVGTLVNPDLCNVGLFFERLKGISTELIFSNYGIDLWGYFIYLFIIILIADIISRKRFSHEALIVIYGIVVVYVGLAFLGYLLPNVDLDNTTKRGLFKLFPLMLLYLANSSTIIRISEGIKKWEYEKTVQLTE